MDARLSQIPYDRTLKVIMLGNAGVGKTSVLHRFIKGESPEKTNATIGADMFERVYTYKNQNYRLQLWDTAGEEKFRSVTASYFRNGNAVLLMYDVTDMGSFYELRPWVQDVKNYFGEENIAIIMVGNKIDQERVVDLTSARNCAQEMSVPYIEISVKTGEGCEQLWDMIVDRAVQIKKTAPAKHSSVRVSTSSTESEKGCC